MFYLYFIVPLALVLLIWVLCRTPSGPKRDAEILRARQLAERGRNQAIFGDEAQAHFAHDHHDQPFTP